MKIAIGIVLIIVIVTSILAVLLRWVDFDSGASLGSVLRESVAKTTGFEDVSQAATCFTVASYSDEKAVIDTIPRYEVSNADSLCSDGVTKILKEETLRCIQDTCVGKDGREYKFNETYKGYVSCFDLPVCSGSTVGAIIFSVVPVLGGLDGSTAEILKVAKVSRTTYTTPIPVSIDNDFNAIFEIKSKTESACDGNDDLNAIRIRAVGSSLQLWYDQEKNEIVLVPIEDTKIYPFILSPETPQLAEGFISPNPNVYKNEGTCVSGVHVPTKYLYFRGGLKMYTATEMISQLKDLRERTQIVRLESYKDRFITA